MNCKPNKTPFSSVVFVRVFYHSKGNKIKTDIFRQGHILLRVDGSNTKCLPRAITLRSTSNFQELTFLVEIHIFSLICGDFKLCLCMCVDHEPGKGALRGKKEFVCGDNRTGIVRKKGKLGELRKRGRKGQKRGRAVKEEELKTKYVHTKNAKMKSITLYASLKKLIRMKKTVFWEAATSRVICFPGESFHDLQKAFPVD